jgi:hypothetical protein
MIAVQPNTTYVGRNTSDGTPARLLPFKPSPERTSNGRKHFKALYNTSLVTTDQVGTPYQFSFVISVFNSIALVNLYNNTNASLTYDVTLNADGTISFSVTDINGTSKISTTQSVEVGWSYELTFQYTYNGQFIPVTFFNRSDFMNIFINGRRANTVIDLDGAASVNPSLAASTITVNSSANTFVTSIAQWYGAWWVSYSYLFVWWYWYYWWYAWWRSYYWWWRSYYWWYWYAWWWWYVWWDCNLDGCEPGNCGPNLCHGEAPFDTIYRYERMVGNIDFVLTGVGIRDINTSMTPAVMNITVPGPVIKAYLYWNTIGGGEAACADTAIFNSTTVSGEIIGCCGNTCWAAYCVNSGEDSQGGMSDQNILNKVWFSDVTALVPGSGSYTISLPGVVPGDFIAFAASDSPYYPGCSGGQGVALLVIYQTDPDVVIRPRQHCCVPVQGQTVTQRSTREIIIWHGAKLLICNGCNPPTIGGSNEHTIAWKTKYTWEPKIATAVGDAQSKFKDSFFWNNIPLPPFPSYFNPYVGKLMHVKTEFLPGHTAKCDCGGLATENTVRAFTSDNCLCWFLFVYSGVQKCVTAVINNNAPAPNFVSPPSPPTPLAFINLDLPSLKLPCCGDLILPTKLNVNIGSSCLAAQTYIMEWNWVEQKYILQPTTVCNCNLFGWLYCVGTQWVLYLALSEQGTICCDGINTEFPVNCSPFGGVGSLVFAPVNSCKCNCAEDLLQVIISPD